MIQSILDPLDLDSDTLKLKRLNYLVTHVFCPLQLPNGDDYTVHNDHSLSQAVTSAARLYSEHVGEANLPEWDRISRMLENLRDIVEFKSLGTSRALSQLTEMAMGDVVVFLIRAQNAAVVFRKQEDVTVFESFEVSPMAENVITTKGKLICSYPGPAIEIPNEVFDDHTFCSELVNFLFHMHKDIILEAAPKTQKAQSTVIETRDTTHPRYISELLTGILRSVGRPANIDRINKRVGDDVVWNNSELPWRRSSLWLVIRVSLQTSLNKSALGHDTYKAFMLFFMCCLASEETTGELSNDLLQFMSAKISRRLRKLGSSAPDWLSEIVLKTCTHLRMTLEERWGQVQASQSVSPVWAPSRLDLPRDIQLSLQTSRDHIRNSLDNDNPVDTPTSTTFDPEHHHRGVLDDFLSSDGSFFEEAYRAEPYVALYDVERAVEEGIDMWVDRVTNNDRACEKLELLANKYSSGAREKYDSNPELLSVMLLTVIELWVALDKIAIKAIPILADYSPQIPTSLLEQLLLSKATCLDRLRLAHQYISHRHSRCRKWSVFSPEINRDSFAVRFYRGSESFHLQCLKSKIEKAAQVAVDEKVKELDRNNAEYEKVLREANRADHEYTVNHWGVERHARYCRKCSLESEYQNMKITVHEWPLPTEQLHAEVVVFELDCPISFNMWRSATFHLLVDICSPSIENKDPYIILSGYYDLLPYLVPHQRSRITLASDAKPFVVTHYKTQSIRVPSLTREQVCVQNGLRFYSYDSKACVLASKMLDSVDIDSYCTHTLPSPTGRYKNLQRYVNSTLHSSNEVMANQEDCHVELSIHEYMAFGHLRSGGLIQWLNVLRELRARSLTFRRPEVHLLFAQAILQVGPLSNMHWEWHLELQQPSFCLALLKELQNLVRDLEANWLELVTMDTISLLLRRLLSSGPDPAISLHATNLLRVVRGKVFSWVHELSKKLTETPGDEYFRQYLRDAAAICRSTFDVDPLMIPELLDSAEDVMILVCCAMFIRNHTPSQISSLPPYSQLLLDRDRRISLAVEDTLCEVVQADDEGIDLAVGQLWPNFRIGSRWTPLQNPNSRWISCATAATADERSQKVHYNILDGSLLVDGKPLGRLPDEIQKHPLYNLIFGKDVLDIVPSDLPGMDYATKGMISDHTVCFALRNNDLVIRAKLKSNASEDMETMELVPHEKMQGDLPAVLIEGHAHWLNINTSILEVRPIDTLWKTAPENWTICCTPGQYCMQKGHEVLVDIRSETWEMISSLLRPLDDPSNLIISASLVDPARHSSLQLHVSLHRYGLSFYVDETGDLQSHNMRGMVYDENQYIGTLFGLVNKLVLRPKEIVPELIPRCVLIPDGDASFRKVGHHVSVEIDTCGSALKPIKYQIFKVDTELGCLTGTLSLTNKLYCVYLHALTSGCGVDPLTGRSGTEEALSLLRSGSCWSSINFSSRDAELLSSIASIFPPRVWYPPNLQRMQQVDWLDLPATSQHHDMYVLSKAIKEHYEKAHLFYENSSSNLFGGFPSQDSDLLERSARRAAYLFPSNMSGQPAKLDVDVHYPARDLLNESEELRAYTAATAVLRRIYTATTTKNILSMVESWPRDEPVSGGTTKLSLRYNDMWLAPDLPSVWLEAYQLLRKDDENKWFQMLFSIPAMVYAKPKLGDLVPVFVAFALSPQFRREDPPPYPSYTVSDGYSPSAETLRGYFSESAHSFECSPESSEPARYMESPSDLRQRQCGAYRSRRDSDANETVNNLLSCWPCETLPGLWLNPNLYDKEKFTLSAQGHFSSCYRNRELKEHLIRIQRILILENVHSPSQVVSHLHQYSFHPSQRTLPSHVIWPLMDELFTRPAPLLRTNDRLPRDTAVIEKALPTCHTPLHRLISTAEGNAENQFQRQYVSALRTSAECLGRETSVTQAKLYIPGPEILVAHYAQCRDRYDEALRDLKRNLGPRSLSEQALEQSGQWPRITPYTLFRSLASNSPIILSDDWKRCLIILALITLELQRARRLLRLHFDNLPEEVRRELQNEGCDGWNAETHPDWLLIQLQSNFLVRRVQAEVSQEMISPRSGANTAMQLNMGEGKSSVIVPIVVAALADGKQLVRVIVPKALTMQMFHILVDRLGGLANRRLYYIPFSRSVQLDHQKASALRELMSECMDGRGILVVQPEHILSLRLLSMEKQLPEAEDTQLVADQLLELQRWLHSHSRDILDESDEILHVRYQLIYTIGDQLPMEGFPERWTTAQQVLGLVRKRASSVRDRFPLGVEYECGPPGSFPHLRILHTDAGQELIAWIVQDVINGDLLNFNFGQLRSGIKDAVRSFISCENVCPEKVQLVKDFAQNTSLWGGLLHLRGLLASGILLFALTERRWRVDYALAPTRTMLAVPYRAKDVPAQRAEFGHPDIAIVLTSLSYYYGGLSEEQLKLSFEILLKQDDPSQDYGLWLQDCRDVPESLRTFNGVNISSSDQWKILYPLFKRNWATVDFYLSNVVFPKEAKEFPSKLSCSGWDLAENKGRLLTGFSGTNDGRYLLPLHITQRDPDHQRGTNAKVLSYLLQPENQNYSCTTRNDGERRNTREFLKILTAQDPVIRVLLDVGAQMLDLQNCELAEAWLDINTDASAAIYFNDDDELMVRTRDGRMPVQPLHSSPFAQQLDQCVVYLDDAHTRGTDIKFPIGFRASVTLGPKVTKDRLVQGCMRMRKLGHGHSIMFFAPLEVDRHIRSVAGKSPEDTVDTMDILHWAIRETCDDIQQRAPHWAQQGMDHTDRFAVWTSFCEGQLTSQELSDKLSDKWLQPEAKKLEDLYAPHNNTNLSLSAFPDIRQRCDDLGILKLHNVSVDEEQEREVAHEVERERQVQRPPRVPAARHRTHQDVVEFIETGVVPTQSDAFFPAFQMLDANSDGAHVWSQCIFTTMDFAKTVGSDNDNGSSAKLDKYMRPVLWVVSTKAHNEAFVILSPYEVNYLLPYIRSSKKVHLHLYTPRVIKSMKPCDDLTLYNIPTVPAGWSPSSSLMDQLNVFAGQLYLKDYKTYIRLCRFLCVYVRDLQGEEDIEANCASDGFIAPNDRPQHLQSVNTFQSSLLDAVKTLVALRRKGMPFSLTHMGQILDGRLLDKAHFRGPRP